MIPGHDELLERLMATFRKEAHGHLDALAAGITELRAQPPAGHRDALCQSLFRHAHSLKGAARVVERLDVAELCQPLEALLSRMRGGGADPDFSLLNLLDRTVARLVALLDRNGEPPSLAQRGTGELVADLTSAAEDLGGGKRAGNGINPGAAPHRERRGG